MQAGETLITLNVVQALQLDEIADRYGRPKAVRVLLHAEHAAREAFDSCLGAAYALYIVDDGREVNGKPFTAGPEPYVAANTAAGSYGK